MVNRFTLFIITTQIFTMSKKNQLILVLKLHDPFCIINDIYEGLKSISDNYEQDLYYNICTPALSC